MTQDNTPAIDPSLPIEQRPGKLTGRPLFRVPGEIQMPWCGSPEEACRVYKTLLNAAETGYFTGGLKRPKAGQPVAKTADVPQPTEVAVPTEELAAC